MKVAGVTGATRGGCAGTCGTCGIAVGRDVLARVSSLFDGAGASLGEELNPTSLSEGVVSPPGGPAGREVIDCCRRCRIFFGTERGATAAVDVVGAELFFAAGRGPGAVDVVGAELFFAAGRGAGAVDVVGSELFFAVGRGAGAVFDFACALQICSLVGTSDFLAQRCAMRQRSVRSIASSFLRKLEAIEKSSSATAATTVGTERDGRSVATGADAGDGTETSLASSAGLDGARDKTPAPVPLAFRFLLGSLRACSGPFGDTLPQLQWQVADVADGL